jgi:hypothetical protein
VEEIILLAMQKTNETVGGGGGLLTTVTPANNVQLYGIKSSGTSTPSNLLHQIKSPAVSTACLTINTNNTNIVPPAALRTLIPVSASVCGINTSNSNISIGAGGDRNNNLKRPLIQQQTQQSSSLPTANVISLVLDVNNSSNTSGSGGQRSTINFIEPSLPRPLVMDSEGTDPVKSNNGNGSTTATIINSSGSWGKVTKNIQPNTNINQRYTSSGNFTSSCNIVNTTSNVSTGGFSKDEPPRKESRLLHYCHICNKGFKVRCN